MRQIPFYSGTNKHDQVNRLAAAACAWSLVVTVTVAVCFSALALLTLVQGEIDDAIGWISQAVVCIGTYYGGYLTATYRTLNSFVSFAKIQAIQAMFAFILVFTIPFWEFYGLSLRAALPVLVGVFLYHRARPLPILPKFERTAFKEMLWIGAPLCFWGTFNTSIWVAVEYSLILKFSGVEGIGLFAIALIMRETLSTLPQAVFQVILPRVVSSYSKGEMANATGRLFKASGILVAIMIAAVVAISYSLDYLVPIFIPKYLEGLGLMKLCLWFAVIQAAALPVSSLFASGKGWLYGRCILCGFLVFIATIYLFTSLYGGAIGVVVASLTGRCARIIVAYYEIWKNGKDTMVVKPA